MATIAPKHITIPEDFREVLAAELANIVLDKDFYADDDVPAIALRDMDRFANSDAFQALLNSYVNAGRIQALRVLSKTMKNEANGNPYATIRLSHLTELLDHTADNI